MSLPTRAELSAKAKFLSQLYLTRGYLHYAARVRGDAFARASVFPWHTDPYPQYERLRAQGPLSKGVIKGVFTTVDHALCKQVLTRRDFGVAGRDDQDALDTQGNISLLQLDPPDHTRIRRVAAPAFTPRRMALYEQRIEALMHELADEAVRADRFDLKKLIAAPLPISVISQLLGVDDIDNDAFTRYGNILGGLLDGPQSLRHMREADQARSALRDMFVPLIEQRRLDPREDMLSTLAQHEGESISADEMIPLCNLLLIAGFETTVNLIGNAIHQLLRHRDQWRRLVDDPSLAAGAIEETLRYDPPVQMTSRIYQGDEPTEIGGITLRPGGVIIPVLAGAGRDPQVCTDPQRYDITRQDATGHLAFSAGIHYCVGAPLAKLEATVALRVIAERMPQLQLDGKVDIRETRVIRGVRTLPVRVTADVAAARPAA
ncbi:MAG: cytochrome P450 [Cumulibacter sp.]